MNFSKNMITQYDLRLALQQSVNTMLRIEVLDKEKKIMGTITGAVSGSMSINGESDIRRTCSFTVQPTLTEHIRLTEDNLLWLDKDIRLSFGIRDNRTREYVFYPLGYYIYMNTSGTYDALSNQLSVTCSDFMIRLDGTKNGQVGALTTLIPAYEENEQTGEVIKYNIIRDVIIHILEQMCGITNFLIDDIGEAKAMPEYNKDWKKYREEYEQWNVLPYDQEFRCGCSQLDILKTLRDLYPGYEMFFEPEQNAFICQRIPDCYEDSIFLDNSFLQKVLISENSSVEMLTVRNICEVWGKVIDADFYTETCSYSGNIYSCTVSSYDSEYCNGDTIGIRINAVNAKEAKLNINSLGTIGIYNENDDSPLKASQLEAGIVYVFKIKKIRENKNTVMKAYLLGHWQAHGMNVLVDGSKSDKYHTTEDGKQVTLYSKEYFQDVYHCESVELTEIPNSPFTVQKLGEILDVKTGGEFENITSDALALERARWENWKNTRLTDNITITTTLLPFMDVNKKLSYVPRDSENKIPRQYIVSSVNHDFSGYTTSITMYRFYPRYKTLINETGTHKVLEEHGHDTLQRFSHDQLCLILSGEDYI